MCETFKLGELGFEHEHDAGDTDCEACWPRYPKPCECGGLVHAEFGDEDKNCNYWLYTKCDRCGDPE